MRVELLLIPVTTQKGGWQNWGPLMQQKVLRVQTDCGSKSYCCGHGHKSLIKILGLRWTRNFGIHTSLIYTPIRTKSKHTDFSSLSAFKRSISNSDFMKYLIWSVTDLYCVYIILQMFIFTSLLLFNYCMYCRGAIRAFRARLLLLYYLF